MIYVPTQGDLLRILAPFHRWITPYLNNNI